MGAAADNVKWNNFYSNSDSDDKPNYNKENHTSPKISESKNHIPISHHAKEIYQQSPHNYLQSKSQIKINENKYHIPNFHAKEIYQQSPHNYLQSQKQMKIHENIPNFHAEEFYQQSPHISDFKSQFLKKFNTNKLKIDNDEVSEIKNKIYNLQYEIKRNKIYLNLIFYDERLSQENKFLYDYFQLNIVGGFYGVKEYCDFYYLLNQLNEHNLPFVLVTSGNSFQKIVPKNLSLKCIESIVIYCYDKNKYMNLYRNYYKVKLITNIFNEVKKFLEAKHFSSYEIDMENQIKTNPLISFY